MKVLFINGSPRKNWTTVKMLQQAMQGASDAGAEAEIIHLYDCGICRDCKKRCGLAWGKDGIRGGRDTSFGKIIQWQVG